MEWGKVPSGYEDPGGKNDVCRVRTMVHSPGIWGEELDGWKFSFYAYGLPRTFLQICVMFCLTQALHMLLLKRFRLPRIISELLAGIILGPTMIGRSDFIIRTLFRTHGDTFVELLSKMGYILFIFLIGVKMDPGMIPRSAKAWYIGIPSVVLPYSVLKFLNHVVHIDGIHRFKLPAIQSTLGIQSLYSFPVIAVLLVDLKIINTELGRLALSTGLICDLLSNFIYTIIANFSIGNMSKQSVATLHSFTLCSGVVALLVFTVRPLSAMIIKRTPEGKPVDSFYVFLMCSAAFFASILADNAGMNYQYGPFILGLMVPEGPPLGSTLVDKLDTIVSGLLTPLLVTYSGVRVDLFNLYDLHFLGMIWITVIFCHVVKYVSIFGSALVFKVPLKDTACLAFILTTQGVVQISFYLYGYGNQTYDTETFSMLNVGVLITASLSHVVVGSLYDYSRTYSGYQRRDIQHNSSSSELRLVTCFHRLEDLLAARKLLEVSFPNKESPLIIYSLHLVDLVGGVTPLLIDHQLGQKTSSSGNSRSKKMMDALASFVRPYNGTAIVNYFTAISLPKFMHHDITTLAFDKLASMIILPFHRKWNQQGRLIMDSSSMRLMNNNVLDLAPCSVGILIDRYKIKMLRTAISTTYHVAVIFIGGADDREALCYAKRISHTPWVQLTVVRLVPENPDAGDKQWDEVLDAEVLKEVRHMEQSEYKKVCYKEVTVRDGVETAYTVRELENVFDLILVGRRHRPDCPQLIGLSEWDDIPELGPIGDMLAIEHIRSPISVLVVQQQYVKNK